MSSIKVVLPFVMLAVSCSTYHAPDLPEVYGGSRIPEQYPDQHEAYVHEFDLPSVPGYGNGGGPSKVYSIAAVYVWKEGDSGFYGGIMPAAPLDLPLLPERSSFSSAEYYPDKTVPAVKEVSGAPAPLSLRESVPLKQMHDEQSAAVNSVEYATVVSPVGDDSIVTVSLDGTGWLYLGTDEEESGISFSSKMSRRRVTDFLFKVDSPGVFKLRFQQQNPLSGGIVVRRILLKAVSVPSKEADSGKSAAENNQEVFKETKSLKALVDGGEYGKALEIYGSAEALSEILLKGTEEKDTDALKFFHDEVVSGHDSYSFFFTESRYAGMTVNAGKLLVKNGYSAAGTDLLEEIVSRNPDFGKMDEILYILGYSFQNRKAIRDERKAAAYYKRIIDDYPASIYWESAKREYVVIKRMYIDVR